MNLCRDWEAVELSQIQWDIEYTSESERKNESEREEVMLFK